MAGLRVEKIGNLITEPSECGTQTDKYKCKFQNSFYQSMGFIVVIDDA